MKARLLFTPITVVMVALILFVATAKAHRLSGTPESQEGKLKQAKLQVTHDRLAIRRSSFRHWTILSPLPAVLVVHRWWLARDLAYVKRLERTVVPAWLMQAFMCIHRGEGAWNDPNAPYYGGLQMDYGFQQTYGPDLLARKGTADHWTPLEQITVAVRAYTSGRGFYPWPTTARRCGLI